MMNNLILILLKSTEENVGDYISLQDLGTLGISTVAVVALVSTIRILFGDIGRPLLWIVFVFCIIISGVVFFKLNEPPEDQEEFVNYLLVFINSLLLFTSSVGTNEALGAAVQNQPKRRMQTTGKQKTSKAFLRSWF